MTATVSSLLFWLWQTTWQVSVLVLLVLAVQLVFRRWLTPRWQYALWALVAVRLVLPVLPSSSMSLFNAMPRIDGLPVWAALLEEEKSAPDARLDKGNESSPLQEHGERRSVDEVLASRAPTLSTAPPPFEDQKMLRDQAAASPDTWAATAGVASSQSENIPSRSWLAGAIITLWLGVALGLLGLSLVKSVLLTRRTACERLPAAHPLCVVVRSMQKRIGLRRRVDVAMTSTTKSPFVVGLLRPTVVLPRLLVERLTARELRLVLLHELAHLRRRDLEVRWVMLVLRAVYWFNPLVWLALSRLHVACELACDQDVLRYSRRTSPADYSRTILRVVETLSANKFLDPLLTPSEGFFQRGTSVKERLTMLSKMSPAKNRKWHALLGAALLAILPASAFTQAVEPSNETETPPQPDDSPAATQPATLAVEQIDAWIEQLGDDDFQTRERATKKLTEAGADAVGALEKATKQSGDAEVRSRAERVLSFFFKGTDQPLRNAAGEALGRIHPDRKDEFQRQLDNVQGAMERLRELRLKSPQDAEALFRAARAAEIEAANRAEAEDAPRAIDVETVKALHRRLAIEAMRAAQIEAARKADEDARGAIDAKRAADEDVQRAIQALQQNAEPQPDAQLEEPAAPQRAKAAAEEIDAWIKQLGDDDFHTREQATKKLTEAGVDAVSALEKAAKQTDDAEARIRAEGILTSFFKGADQPLRKAAGEALGRIHPDRKDEFQRQRAAAQGRPLLGVALEDDGGGAKITAVIPDSAAEKAGVQVDDIVLRVNGAKITDIAAMVDEIRKQKPGDKVTLKIKRGDEELELPATLGGADRLEPEDEARISEMEALRACQEALEAIRASLEAERARDER